MTVALTTSDLILGNTQPTNTIQQTFTTSSTRVVIVVIPGFPVESILLGALLGVLILALLRRWKRKRLLKSDLE